jgi:hypothetical protein
MREPAESNASFTDAVRRALDAVNQPDGSADHDQALDAAFEILVPLADVPARSEGFSRRVMLAVGQAPLPAGRVPLATRRPAWQMIGGLGAAAAAVAWAALAAFGRSAAPMLIALFVRAGFSCIASMKVVLQLWVTAATAGGALAQALVLPELVLALTALTLVGMLSMRGLMHFLSIEQEPSPWRNNSFLV